MAPKTSISSILLLTIIGASYGRLYSVPTVYQRIYKEIDSIKACFRLLNATHQIGCSATPSNVSGVVWYVESQDNLTHLLDTHHHAPYIVVMEPHLLTAENVRTMKKSGHVNGVVTYYNMSGTIPPALQVFSPAEGCPNSGFGLDNHCRDWNANGSQLTYDDFEKFAIFTLTSENSYQEMIECFNDHNKDASGGYGDFPLCSAELQADMSAVISTPECYRRAQVWTTLGVPDCQPLGDDNVWGSLFELQENKDIIMVATKLDSSALIPDLAFGANNEAAGIVTLLAVAEALGKLKKSSELTGLNKQIMFVFFHGESFDYIGSSRMVYDMMRGKFPYSPDRKKQQPPLLNITNISSILELSQVGIQSNSSSETPMYYLHSNDNTSPLHKTLLEANDGISFQPSSSANPQLPSASAQMFLRENNTIPVVIVTDYNEQFNNQFFGSRYDTIANLLEDESTLSSSSAVVTHLTNLASNLAQTLLNVSEPTYRDPSNPPSPPTASPETVAVLLECFLVQTNCSLLRTVLNPAWVAILNDEPVGRYVTVNSVSNYETQFAFNLLAYFTGIRNTNYTTCKECDKAQSNQVYTHTTMSGENYDSSAKNCTCFKSYTHRHEATSPAFHMKDYSSTYYSTWTESNWGGIGMRIYLVTYPLFEAAIFFVGLTVSVLSVFITWQCSRKSRQIFSVSANNIIGQS